MSPAEPGKAQCFAVKRGDLKERLDPKFILHGGHQPLKGVHLVPLGELVVREPEYGSGERAIPIQSPADLKYIRITDFDDDGIVPGNEFVTAENIEDRYILVDGDVLFARSGATAGKTLLYSSEIGSSIFAGYCIRFRFDAKRALPSFIYFCTKTSRYKAWVRSIQRPSGQPNINKEEFKSFTVPFPPLAVQREMVVEMEAARESRRRKMQEADALLSGIDAFLLDSLGITLPEPRVDPRWCWAVRRSETIIERRLDPYRYAPRTRKLRQMIAAGIFKTHPLATLIEEPVSGDWGVAASERDDTAEYVDCLVIRSTEFDDIENLILDNDRVRHRFLEIRNYQAKLLQVGDILLEKSGGGPLQPVGRVAIIQHEHLKDRRIFFANFVMRLRPTGDVLPIYLWSFLGLVNRCGLTASMQAQTHGIRNLKLDEYLLQPVPVPDGRVQEKIAKEVLKRRMDARRLREEAAREWEAAKAHFEARLLGEAVQ